MGDAAVTVQQTAGGSGATSPTVGLGSIDDVSAGSSLAFAGEDRGCWGVGGSEGEGGVVRYLGWTFGVMVDFPHVLLFGILSCKLFWHWFRC